jgi:two-component system, LuxR family, response regulator FixJ
MQDKVYIVEDDQGICNALQWLFKSIALQTHIFHSGVDFLTQYQHDWHGCLLLDIRMPLMSGLELQEKLNILNNQLPIIFMTGHGDIPLAVRAMKAGAFDFITKPFNNHNLIEQIHQALKQKVKIRPDDSAQEYIKKYSRLTPRELDVLACVVEGQLNKQIALSLKISISTVEMHRANVMDKLGAKSIVDLIKNYVINAHLLKNTDH